MKGCGVCECLCAHRRTSSACVQVRALFVQRVCSAFGLEIWIYSQSGVTGQTSDSSTDERRRGIHSAERKGRGRESRVNLSKSLLCGVQTQSAFHNGLINGTMSRSGEAIIADDLALWGYLSRSAAALKQMIWTLEVGAPPGCRCVCAPGTLSCGLWRGRWRAARAWSVAATCGFVCFPSRALTPHPPISTVFFREGGGAACWCSDNSAWRGMLPNTVISFPIVMPTQERAAPAARLCSERLPPQHVNHAAGFPARHPKI